MIMPPLVAAVDWVLLHTGAYVALWLWALMLTLALLFMTAYPILIAPLFNKFTPLPPGDLR